ncbi:SO_0444 family Cu/Zn efflux transporter [Shewanella fidelis]|uniref:SO_0444 family Cu/Zn efflux transporter n=1 Tax=Shewanella fidelis TaxID=173509 RepID=A0AAW8NT25_9GAMM|nr:SO_0444 family Cu/Zn efflux transporter [Shewanella fidelis]MDR8525371.1 SO_0444 family Cu/Zn efflux transporter [Shewanella fidelis]MDW4813593.1 SO_0444 family Cu/Zn efflux transporter [Shewanella fidelis]MDW4817749.1 SO_0444 family Cu/Zn efflux transporter [Shewanella fidelis]MDW4821816.1 SO_0444 family Cu/Zn efflux transporter [Shewanella fidelis]MDW4825921.1 SO_0444 family Cu/Zn efflux transporter [Shewanella fidelis]
MLLENFIELFLESAPWLLLGLVLAGMLKMFVPMAWMQKQLGGHGVKTTVKAAVLGAPLPLCSCGVIPAAVGLRRSGASKAATTSFLVSTPETGVDSVTVSYVLLGPFMAIVRPIAAVMSAIVAGLLVGRDDDDEQVSSKQTESNGNSASASSCCSSKKVEPKIEAVSSCCSKKIEPKAEAVSSCCSSKEAEPKLEAVSSCCSSKKAVETVEAKTEKSSCCSTKAPAAVTPEKSSCCSSKKTDKANHSHSDNEADGCCESTKDIASELKGTSVISRIGKGLHYAATDLVRDTTIWLLIGLFFAALVQTYVPADFMAKWGDGILAMLVMVLISVPMYICATASTPIAAGLLLAGVSPGAVLVFMLAGPATNIATLGVVTKELGKRALYGYLGGVLGVALVSGILVNYLVDTFGFVVMPQIGEQHELLPAGIVYTSGVILAILMAKVFLDKLPKNWWRRDCCS